MRSTASSVAVIFAALLLFLAGCVPRNPPATVPPRLVLDYKTVYQEGDFVVQEAYLGPHSTWSWDEFVFPTSRIQDSVPDPIRDDKLLCLDQALATGWCTRSLEVVLPNGTPNRFDLTTDSRGMGGHYVLKRNGTAIWEDDLRAATTDALFSWRAVGDQVALEYIDIQGQGVLTHSILLTQDDGVVDIVKETGYSEAFAPNEIRGHLAYFAHNRSTRKVILVFDGREVGPQYTDVFNQYCCWDGPPVQVHGNGELVDFFAYREDGWYHVQAGYFSDSE